MLRFALSLAVIASWPNLAASDERMEHCRFDLHCTESGCTDVSPLESVFFFADSQTIYLSWLEAIDQHIDLTFSVTPSGTVMAHGTDGNDMLLVALGKDGEVAMTRVASNGTQSKLVGACE